MGYTIRPKTQIRDFWPDDTDDKIYISVEYGDISLAYIQERIDEKWPGSSPRNIKITGEKIHTSCLDYDLYDPTDWTNFIIITRTSDA